MRHSIPGSAIAFASLFVLLFVLAGCKDDSGPSASSVCKKACEVAEECYDYDDYDDWDFDECVEDCVDGWDDEKDDYSKCYSKALKASNCYYSEMLKNDCDYDDADDECDDLYDDVQECWEDNYGGDDDDDDGSY